MNILFDFDDVLFHTKCFGDDFEGVFHAHGVSKKCFRETYEQSRKTTKIPNYNFDRHIEILEKDHGIDGEQLRGGVDKYLADTSTYIFPDVVESLKGLGDAGHNLFLVTYGTPQAWQEKKVFASGIDTLFERCIIGEIHKGQETAKLLREFPVQKSYFIDDRCAYLEDVKTDAPEAMTILMKRPEGRYNDERSPQCDLIAHSMDEVEKLVLA